MSLGGEAVANGIAERVADARQRILALHIDHGVRAVVRVGGFFGAGDDAEIVVEQAREDLGAAKVHADPVLAHGKFARPGISGQAFSYGSRSGGA